MGYGLMNGFINHLYTPLRTTSNYSTTANLPVHKLLHTKSSPACSVFNSRSLATASNSGDSSAPCAQILSSQPPKQNSNQNWLLTTIRLVAIWHQPSSLLFTGWLSTDYSLGCQSQSQSHIATDGQSVSKSWCWAPSGAYDQIFITVWQLRSCFFFCGAPSLTRGQVYVLSESLPALVSHLL
jgi:hypothetical protein